MTDLQMAAVEYVVAGFRILALSGKRPNGRVHGESWSWDDSFHGVPDCVEDSNAIKRAFSDKVGTTGIAILIPPDFLVADVDSDRAAQLLIDLGWEHHDDSIIAKTKNGLHVWFWYPGAIDGTYEWVTPLVSDGVRYMPDILPEMARERFKVSDQFTELKPAKDTMTTFNMTPAEGVPWYLWEKEWSYQTEGLERAIETAADGNQNNVIHWAAMTCREEGVPYELAMERLLAAAIKGGHPRTRARDTIKGAYKRAPRG